MSYKKYYIYKEQVSFDEGLHWTDTGNETPSGDPIGTYPTLEECESAAPTGSSKYLTIIPLADGAIELHNAPGDFTYSFNSGATWNNANKSTSMTLHAGKELWVKGQIPISSVYGVGTFSANTQFVVEGNPLCLLYGDNFQDITTVPNFAFSNLFYQCENLMSVENLALPATTLGVGCYSFMFADCTNITTSPELPAEILPIGCYHGMFYGCSNLTSIKCLATDVTAENCTEQWVTRVSPNGTFTKSIGFIGWNTGDDGIPEGWTVQEA